MQVSDAHRESKTRPRSPVEAGLLFGLVAALFAASVYLRAEGLGRLPAGISSWMTTGSTICAKNWHREGAWNLRFTLYRDPASIEQAGARTPYLSFPPGAIVPLYLLGRLLHLEPTPALAMSYNLLCQFLIACALGFTVLRVLRFSGVSGIPALLLSLVSPLLYLFLRSPFYEHQMGYFSDQAVMLPFALLVYLEVLRATASSRRLRVSASACLTIIGFWGIFTDWFFAFVLACLFTLRLLRGELGSTWRERLSRSFLFWTPACLALALFAYQLAYHDGFPALMERFIYGAGVEQGGNPDTPGLNPRRLELARFFSFNLASRFWKDFVPMAFGPLGKPLLLGATVLLLVTAPVLLAFRVLRKPIPIWFQLAAAMTFLTVAPCFLYCQVFQTHCSVFVHFFTTLKFAPVCALMPPLLVSGAVLPLYARSCRIRRVIAAILTVLTLGASAGYLVWMGDPREAGIYDSMSADYERVGRFIGARTGYNDIAFSFGYKVGLMAPHYLVYSMKPLHSVMSLQDIHDTVRNIDAPCTVNLFFTGEEAFPPESGLALLAEHAFDRYDAGDLHLCKVRGVEFWYVYETWLAMQSAPSPSGSEKSALIDGEAAS